MGWNNNRALETGLAEPQRLCRFCAITVVLVAHISGVARSEENGGAAAKTPEWIWAVEQRSSQQKVLLHRTFRLSGRAGSAQLRVAAVFSSCKVRLNDRAIVAIDPYAPRLDLDVTDHLRTGENAIEIFAVSGDGPAELAASLQIELTDGSRVLVETGTDWSARSNDVGGSDQSGDPDRLVKGRDCVIGLFPTLDDLVAELIVVSLNGHRPRLITVVWQTHILFVHLVVPIL